MHLLSSYEFIIFASLIIILSYFFNRIASRTNIPSVLMLIATGIGINYGMKWMGYNQPDIFPILEILGIVGLIMIVLEAALELKLSKDKFPVLWKSFATALIGLVTTAFACAFVINYFIDELDIWVALLYATPLSILSSAVVIPSVTNLIESKKEFHIYESTFSDILGIMMFYFVLGQVEATTVGNPVATFAGNLILTLVIAIVASYALIIVFQKLRTQVKLFLLIAILLLLYSVAKMLHLSSLIIILIFGLIMANEKIFFKGFLKNWIDLESLKGIKHDLHTVTVESAFVVRTFFFLAFGISISLGSLINVKVVAISLCMLILSYLLRFLMLKIFLGRDIMPQIFVAPRGLITVLLFFAIPQEILHPEFDSGILLFVIIATSLMMTYALILNGQKKPRPITEVPVEEGEIAVVEMNPEESDGLPEGVETDSKVAPPENENADDSSNSKEETGHPSSPENESNGTDEEEKDKDQ